MNGTDMPVASSTSHIETAVLSALSDDDCVDLLAREISIHDPDHLDDVAKLIGRLVVSIEL